MYWLFEALLIWHFVSPCNTQHNHIYVASNCDFILWLTVQLSHPYNRVDHTYAVMNKFTYVSFHKVGWEQPSEEVVNFVAVLLQIYWIISVPKIIKIWGLTKLLQK